MNAQLDFGFKPGEMIGALPPILTLEEFLDQLERDYECGDRLKPLRAALKSPHE